MSPAINPWPRRIAGWVATFFLVAAVGQTLLIGAVIVFGERVRLYQHADADFRYTVTLTGDSSILRVSSSRFRVLYRYKVNDTHYDGAFDWSGEVSEGSEYAHINDFDIAVWSPFPSYAIPLLRGHNPLARTLTVWFMAILGVAVYLALCRYGPPRQPSSS
jgi:hypothetical protein